MRFKTLIQTFALSSAVVIIYTGNVSAQAEKTPVRRNSPFAPNPKKRIETPPIAPQTVEPSDNVKSVETGSSTNDVLVNTSGQENSTQNTQSPEPKAPITESAEPQKPESQKTEPQSQEPQPFESKLPVPQPSESPAQDPQMIESPESISKITESPVVEAKKNELPLVDPKTTESPAPNPQPAESPVQIPQTTESPAPVSQMPEPVTQNPQTSESRETSSPTPEAETQNSQPANQTQNSQPANEVESTIAKNTFEVAKRATEANILPSEIYKVGVGDILYVGLQNAPSKETNYFTVLQDGKIDYPLAGEMVSVAGLTTDEIEDSLKEKIRLYENAQVSVKVREYNSHVYTVLGMVEKSGEKYLQREAVPLFVVRAEAIVGQRANQAKIKRKNSDEQIVDLKDEKADETLIFPGDIVEFGEAEAPKNVAAEVTQYYYIGGNIVSGGQKDFHAGLTLTQAILASGGLKSSKVKKVVIRRKNEDGTLMPMPVDLKAVKDGKAIDPVIVVGDTIEIED